MSMVSAVRPFATVERGLCARKAAEIAGLADRLKAAALDADLATEG